MRRTPCFVEVDWHRHFVTVVVANPAQAQFVVIDPRTCADHSDRRTHLAALRGIAPRIRNDPADGAAASGTWSGTASPPIAMTTP